MFKNIGLIKILFKLSLWRKLTFMLQLLILRGWKLEVVSFSTQSSEVEILLINNRAQLVLIINEKWSSNRLRIRYQK